MSRVSKVVIASMQITNYNLRCQGSDAGFLFVPSAVLSKRPSSVGSYPGATLAGTQAEFTVEDFCFMRLKSRDAVIQIYVLIDPESARIRYVGVTSSSLSHRRSCHLTDARRRNGPNKHKCSWIRKLVRKGLVPDICAIETVTVENWAERERYWISHFRETGESLTNVAIGGEGSTGIVVSESTKAKIRAARARQAFSAETRALWSAHRKGATWCKGPKGHKRQPEELQKTWATRRALGKDSLSPETRRKKSEAMQGKTWSLDPLTGRRVFSAKKEIEGC